MYMSTGTKKTTLRANDLSCPSCVAKIEKSLKSLDGVEQAEVHFTTGRIAVVHDPSRASTDALVRAVADAGYTARASAF
jgi:copper chaperone CopZ